MNALKQSLLALALAGAFTSANATPVDWTFSNTVIDLHFSDIKGSLTGSFTYDADTGSFSNFYAQSSLSGNYNSLTQIDADTYQIGGGTGINYLFNFTVTNPFTNAGGDLSFSGTSVVSTYTVLGHLIGVPRATATAVPEPEVYAMMLAGLGLVGFAARRKQQAA